MKAYEGALKSANEYQGFIMSANEYWGHHGVLRIVKEC